EAIAEASVKIRAEYFFVPAHREIFTTICDLWNAQKGIDLITVTNALRDRGELEKVGGPAYVAELATFVPTAANVGHYIDIVCDKYILRETRRGCEDGHSMVAWSVSFRHPSDKTFENFVCSSRERRGRPCRNGPRRLRPSQSHRGGAQARS